jgi:hypothetical protein
MIERVLNAFEEIPGGIPPPYLRDGDASYASIHAILSKCY